MRESRGADVDAACALIMKIHVRREVREFGTHRIPIPGPGVENQEFARFINESNAKRLARRLHASKKQDGARVRLFCVYQRTSEVQQDYTDTEETDQLRE